MFVFFFITAHNHLSGFTITSFILDQPVADLISFSNTLMSSFVLFLAVYIELPSANFGSSTFLLKNRSFVKILDKMEPNIEPCSIPDKKVFEKHSQCHLLLHPVLYILSMNTQKLLHPRY